jgi:Centrosomin N-terminal motif 1
MEAELLREDDEGGRGDLQPINLMHQMSAEESPVSSLQTASPRSPALRTRPSPVRVRTPVTPRSRAHSPTGGQQRSHSPRSPGSPQSPCNMRAQRKERDQLRADNFELKMTVHYLTDQLNNYVGEGEDMIRVESLNRENALLSHERAELQAQLTQARTALDSMHKELRSRPQLPVQMPGFALAGTPAAVAARVRLQQTEAELGRARLRLQALSEEMAVVQSEAEAAVAAAQQRETTAAAELEEAQQAAAHWQEQCFHLEQQLHQQQQQHSTELPAAAAQDVVQQLQRDVQQLRAEKQEAVSMYQRAVQQHSVAIHQQQQQHQQQQAAAVSNRDSSGVLALLQGQLETYAARDAKLKEQNRELRERYRKRKEEVAERDVQIEALTIALNHEADKANAPGGAQQLQQQVQVRQCTYSSTLLCSADRGQCVNSIRKPSV